jgi:hypothetical protein
MRKLGLALTAVAIVAFALSVWSRTVLAPSRAVAVADSPTTPVRGGMISPSDMMRSHGQMPPVQSYDAH